MVGTIKNRPDVHKPVEEMKSQIDNKTWVDVETNLRQCLGGETRPVVRHKSLILDHVEIREDDKLIVKLDASIQPGQILTLMGPSGSGKSTLINAISGFLPREFSCAGQIQLGDEIITRLAPEERDIGVLFQDALLFPHFSVLQNILYAMPKNVGGAQRLTRANALLKAVGMAEYADRDPATLSGGQKTRVALMRVLAARPQALLLDEPFAKLDTHLRDAVRKRVFEEIKMRALPTLLVTHDVADAKAAGGIVVEL